MSPGVYAQRPRFPVNTFPSQLNTSSVQLDTFTFQLGTPTVQLKTLSVQLETPTVQLGTLTVQLKTLTVQLDASTSQLGTLTVRLGTLTLRLSAPTVQLDALTVQLNAPGVQFNASFLWLIFPKVASIGDGDIIGLAISLEVGNVNRFEEAGNYVSYARCCPSGKWTNDKKKGEGNRKNGNKYLSWAYVEAANFTIRYCPYAKAYFEKKLKKTGKRAIAIKSVAGKLAKANYYMLKDKVKYDPEKAFGIPKRNKKGHGSKPRRGLAQKPLV